MSSVSISKPPKYCRQRDKNRADRAYVRIDGKTIWLGAYASPESKERYADLIGSPKPTAIQPTEVITVAMIMAGYLEFAQTYYRRPDGKPGREYELIREVLRFVRKNCSDLPAKDFGPKRLKEIREALIEAGHCRKYINKNVHRIRRMFKWATSEELIPVAIHTALLTVPGLKQGRTKAPDLPPVMPVEDAIVEATLPYLPVVIADMVKLQRLTAMRGGEVVQMRPCDIDRTGKVWIYRPSTHKTQHAGKERKVMIGPKGQAILLRYLVRDKQAYCFRPCDSEEKRQAERAANRRTPMSCGNVPGSNVVDSPKKQPGEHYSTDSYRRAIARACDKAFPAPEGMKGKALAKWKADHRWCPHRLRHSAATEIRSKFGLEEAQILLGHSQAAVTQIYAERDLAKGVQVAQMIG